MRTFLTIFVILLVLLIVRLTVYTVDASEYVYVTVLGQHVATHDGARDGAGLHFGWPWPLQLVQRLDRRLQTFDLPAAELLTPDKDKKKIDKTLSVEAYVCWRIADADGVERFIQSLGTVEYGQTILRQHFNSQLIATIGQIVMDDLISTDPSKKHPQDQDKRHVDDTMDKLKSDLMTALKGPVRDRYGIDLVDMRLRRFYHPSEVRNAIFERIKSERKKKVIEYEKEGERQAKKIENDAKEEAGRLINQAEQKKKILKDEADADAAALINLALRKDPEFAELLRSLDSLEKMVAANKTLLLLSTKNWPFRLLNQTPHENKGPEMKAGPENKKGGQ